MAAASGGSGGSRNGNGGRLIGRHGSHVQAGTRSDRGQDSKGFQHGALHRISGGYDSAAGEWFIEFYQSTAVRWRAPRRAPMR